MLDGENAILDLGGGGEGGAGGDQGGDQGGSEGGGDEALDTFGAEGDQGAEGGEEGGGEGDQSRESGGSQARTGQYDEKRFRADLAKVKELDPAIAKEFQRAFYKSQQINALGSMQDLQQFKDTIELHGGLEGINEMVEEVEGARALEDGFKNGDKRVIEGWAQDYPDGFKRLILPAIDKIGAMDPAYWESSVGAPVATQFLDKYGVFDAVGNIGQAIKDGKLEDAARIYNDLVTKVLKPMRGLADKARQADPLGKDRENLDRERSEVLSEKQKVFYGGVRQDVNRVVTGSINAKLRNLIGNRRMTVTQGNRIRREINSELSRIVNSDANYQRQYKTVMAAADHDRAVQFITKRANANVEKAVRTVLRDFQLLGTGGNGGGAANGGAGTRQVRRVPPGSSGTGSNGRAGATQVVNMRPKAGDVDFTKSEKATWLLPHGQVWGKDGKLYKW